MFWDEESNKDDTQKSIMESLGDVTDYFKNELKQVPALVAQNLINSAPTADDIVNKKPVESASSTMAVAGSTPPSAASGVSTVGTLKKYLPWIAGGIAAIVIIYFATKRK